MTVIITWKWKLVDTDTDGRRMETLETGSKKEWNSNSPDSKLYRNSIEIKTPEEKRADLIFSSSLDILPNIQTDEMKAVRKFSIVLIFSVQPAVTTHLINTSVLLTWLNSPSPLPQDGHAGDGDD